MFLLLCLLLLHYAAAPSLFSQTLVIDPESWQVGTLDAETLQRTVITIRNTSSLKTELSIIPTCDCLEADPAVLSIQAEENRTVALFYDPVDDSGETTKLYLLRGTTEKGTAFDLFYEVSAFVTPGEAAAEKSPKNETVPLFAREKLLFFYTPGCSWCEGFLNDELAEAKVEKINVLDPDQYSYYLDALKERGTAPRELPALAVGSLVLQGKHEIETGIAGEIGSPGDNPGGIDLTLLTVIGAGLLDGINPCAFTTLIFLISALSLSGRSRKEILFIGTLFSAGIFAAYSLIGLGFLGAVRSARYFPLTAKLMDWLLFGILLLFSLLSLRDWHLIREGRTNEILLQLPKPLKKRIHTSIRATVRTTDRRMTAVAAGTLSMAAAVSLFELTCTGQVYLPAIVFMVRNGINMTAIFYLLIYNTAFILPLVAVFILVYRGVTSDILARLFRKHSSSVKLAMAGLFAVLACLSILM